MDAHLNSQLEKLSTAMFDKGFFGIHHGALSAKTSNNRFIINTKDAIFNKLTDKDLIELTHVQDYRWHHASSDSLIHQQIYEHISEAKFVTYAMPPYTTAYALQNWVITPKDYFASKALGTIEVYDPKSFEDWYDRANSEIFLEFQRSKKSILIIRGYGVYAYDRDIIQLAKKIAILENSCRILAIASGLEV
jgi:L-fuculose-phosphate aldolase